MTAPPPPRPDFNLTTRSPAPGHLRTAANALAAWWRAATLDALIVGILWFVGLEILHVPWAPLWALIGAVCQFIPGVGGMIALAGPAIATALAAPDDVLFHLCMVLALYALIVILEGLVIGPYLLHRTTFVPWWASLLGPIVLGVLIPPWGVLIAPPLLAVVYAFKRRGRASPRT